MNIITADLVSGALPVWEQDAHKYLRGICSLVVGSELYAGAAVLASRAAHRMGAGYIHVYSCPSVAAALHIVQPSAVVSSTDDILSDMLERKNTYPCATVIGCGLDFKSNPEHKALVTSVLNHVKEPVVVDGSALSLFADKDMISLCSRRHQQGCATVITPHHGEAARCSAVHKALYMNDAQWCLTLAQTYQVTCVLKGPKTYIAHADTRSCDEVYVMDDGQPVLAQAGTGDILAGIIGGLLAGGASVHEAVCGGSYIHALAGNEAYAQQGVCATTEDVLAAIPQVVSSLRETGHRG